MKVKKENISDGVKVIFIPDYIYKALEVNKVSLADLEDRYRDNNWSDFNYMDTVMEYKKTIFEKLARHDVEDFIVANTRIPRDLRVVCESITNVVYALRDSEKVLYKDTEVLKERLYNILLDYNIKHKDSYELRMGEKTVFIILKNGFTNLLVAGNSEDKFVFYKTLLDFMFTYFSYYDVVYSSYFTKYLKTLR